MELETMFVEQKWNILRELSYDERSPLQLSETLGTSMANISQQLRLLEAAKLVEKRKIKNRDKGKPRSLFSLTGDFGYLIAASKNFAQKQLVPLRGSRRAIMQIWFVENEELHEPLQQLYWSLYAEIKSIEGIVLVEGERTVSVFVCPKKGAEKKVSGIASCKNKDIKVVCKGITEMRADLKRIRSGSFYVLHDPREEFTFVVQK